MLVLRQELDEPTLSFRQRRCPRIANVEIHGDGSPRIDATQTPSVGASSAHLKIADVGPLLAQRCHRSNGPRDLELPGREHFHGGPERHLHLARILWHVLLVRSKHSPETLLEHGLAEGISQHHVPARGLHQLSHLQYAHLIQGARKYIHHVHGRRRRVGLHRLRTGPLGILVPDFVPFAEAGVELAGRLVQRLGIAAEVGVAANVLRLESRHDGAGTRGAGPSDKHHDASAGAGEGEIEDGGGNAEGASGAACDALIGWDGPGILSQVLKDAFQGHATFRYGKEEAT
mmetsp:Transcript_37556/g.78665  ORF Transcript_37556/g.78665 Transcript_37556/m.78665 type:complete len:288 (-) Transcript_37556:873-1736(-)